MHNPNDFTSLPSYENRLKIICLEKLDTRRINLSAVFIFKILHRNIDSLELKNMIKINNNRRTRVSKYLTEIAHKTNYGLNSPLCRGIRIFNMKIHCYKTTMNVIRGEWGTFGQGALMYSSKFEGN
jgi:hypothetical protein